MFSKKMEHVIAEHVVAGHMWLLNMWLLNVLHMSCDFARKSNTCY